jgi:hypothetical protein
MQTFQKRDKERKREEKRREKAQKRQERAVEKANRPPVADGVDPDLVGIVPGPQPPIE